MFRLLILLAVVAFAGWGLMWLADNPGWVTVIWGGVEYRVSLMFALGLVAAVAIVWSIIWGLLRFVFRAPSLMSLGARSRRREKGLKAVSRGLIAVNTGDTRLATKHAAEANRLLGQEPIAKLLNAQAAQLVGDRPAAVAAYNAMLEHQETHGLGLRGLHVEARRGGDHEAALQYAVRANARAPAAWAGQAVLDDRTRRGDWTGALATVDSNAAAKLIDKPTAQRWRAVIKTAMAQEAQERDPKAAMALAQEACRASPSLVPAAALYGRLAGAGGDYRRATKVIEAAYAQTPHPDLAAAYLRVRHGDSTGDRLSRARSLARAAPGDPESMLTVGRAALDDHDLRAARAAVAPLLASDSSHGRPTRRVCLLMADIETADGNQGAVREWLSRAARAPRDRAWVADGVISDRWSPVSPSGALDAFVWRTPDERLTALPEPEPTETAPPPPPPSLPPRVEAALSEATVQPAPEPMPAPEPTPTWEAPPPVASDTLRSAPASSTTISAPRPGVVVDPDSMAPDDPGPGEPDRPRRRSWIYADD
jgi:HemY protein